MSETNKFLPELESVYNTLWLVDRLKKGRHSGKAVSGGRGVVTLKA